MGRSPSTIGALALSFAMVAGTLAPRRGEAATAGTAMARAADRVTERRVRGAIRSDPFLGAAARRVKVTSRRGVVRLVGRVATAKERSSIAFKAGQNALSGRIDDRVRIGDGAEGTMQ